MSGTAIPAYNDDDRNHWFIWHVLAHEMTQEDFEAIQLALIEREDDHKAIDKTQVVFHEFDKGTMMQPRPVPEFYKEQAHRYVDWSTAMDIWMILSKYADLYSKK